MALTAVAIRNAKSRAERDVAADLRGALIAHPARYRLHLPGSCYLPSLSAPPKTNGALRSSGRPKTRYAITGTGPALPRHAPDNFG